MLVLYYVVITKTTKTGLLQGNLSTITSMGDVVYVERHFPIGLKVTARHVSPFPLFVGYFLHLGVSSLNPHSLLFLIHFPASSFSASSAYPSLLFLLQPLR